MKIYRAETGQSIHWHSNPSRIKTLNDLKQELEQDSGVPVSEQILMTSFGKLVRQENLNYILEAKGKDEFIVFCFDRRYLSVNDEDIEALLDAETPPLEPKIPALDGNQALKQTQSKATSLTAACNAYIILFADFDAYSSSIMKTVTAHKQLAKSIVDEHKFQSMALNVALTNLEDHRKLSEASIKDFVTRAKKELIRQQTLSNSADNDLNILRHVRIHPSLLPLLEGSQAYLIDFVDQDHLERLRQDTDQLCDFLTDQITLLTEESSRMALDEKEFCIQVAENTNLHALDAILSDIQQYEESTRQYRKKVNRDLKRVCQKIADLLQKPVQQVLESLSIVSESMPKSSASFSSSTSSFTTMNTPYPLLKQTSGDVITSTARHMFHAFDHLAQVHIEDYLVCLADYELKIRKRASELILSKRNSIAMFIRNMAVVSEFQRHVGQIQPTLHENMSYLDHFKETYEGSDLQRLRDILFSYGAIMIELVRRKEFSSLLIVNSDLIADTLASYRTDEENRREHFRHTITKSMPFFKLSMTDKPSPQCEVSVVGIDHEDHVLEKQDILDFISIINQVYSNSPQQLTHHLKQLSFKESTSRLTEEQDEEERLLSVLREMIGQIDSMQQDFKSHLRDNFFDSPSLSVQDVKPLPDQASQACYLSASSSAHAASSIFSVIEEDDKRWLIENKDLKVKLTTAEQEVTQLTERNQEQLDEINRLKETIKLLEHEKEEFESTRKSFLHELKTKDVSAEMRLATAEKEFADKLNDIRYELEEERRMKKNLEIEHNSEMKTLQQELSEVQSTLADERDRFTRDIQRLQQEQEIRSEAIQKALETEQAYAELSRKFREVCQETVTLKEKLQTEREHHEQQLARLEKEMDVKERATEEIKAIQQQTRSMVKRAQDDWESKNEELKRIKQDHASLSVAIRDLLKRFMPSDNELSQVHLETYISSFKQQLEAFEREYDISKEELHLTTQRLSELVMDYTQLKETHHEWKVIASRMAERLEDFRKNLVFETVNQLQLPMDEEELNVLQKKLTPNEDDTAVWNQILQLTSSINTQKFVLRVHKRVKDNYEQAKQFKKEYRAIKEKYNRLCTSHSEKIAFRNFQVGDIALFLPTRNASGKPWAAFNINAPHYFLRATDNMSSQMEARDWIVARIASITECVADAASPESNPYGLSDGVKYYLVDAGNWRHNRHTSKKRQLTQDNGLASLSIPSQDAQQQQQQKRPSFGHSSSSSFVHSYSFSK